MFDDMVAQSKPVVPQVAIDPENDTAIMLYTGGTTGVPKGAELTHTNFTYDVMAGFEYIRITQGEGKPHRQRNPEDRVHRLSPTRHGYQNPEFD